MGLLATCLLNSSQEMEWTEGQTSIPSVSRCMRLSAGKPITFGTYEELSLVNEAIPPQIDELIKDSPLSRERRVESAKSFSTRLSGALRADTSPCPRFLRTGDYTRWHQLWKGFRLKSLTNFRGGSELARPREDY